MTTKEKDYVSECFNRNINFFKTNIDYKNIFNFEGLKLPFVCTETEGKKSLVFGKESKKNNKRSRQFCSLDIEDMSESLSGLVMLEDVIAKITLSKYYEDIDDFMDKVVSEVHTNISKTIKISKFFPVFEVLYLKAKETDQSKLFKILIENHKSISEIEGLNTCLNNILDRIPHYDYESLDQDFLDTFMYTNSGILLSTSILIKNRELSEYFYYFIVKNDKRYLDNDKIWIFLAVLVTAIDDDQRFKLVEITRDKIYELARTDMKAFENTKYFLKSIGLRQEDIL